MGKIYYPKAYKYTNIKGQYQITAVDFIITAADFKIDDGDFIIGGGD